MGYSPIHGMHMRSIPGPRKSLVVTILAVDDPGYPSVARHPVSPYLCDSILRSLK